MIITLLNIIRWKQHLYLIFVLFLFKFCFLSGYGFETILSFFDLAILTTSILLLLASSYLVTFFYKKKGSKKLFFVKESKILAITFGILGLLLSTFLCFKMNKPNYSFIFFISYTITFIYSKQIKHKTFTANIVKSFLKSFAILFICWFDFPINLSSSQLDLFFSIQVIVVLYVIISFLSNIGREIIIDINNINHDNRYNHKTLPILLGRKRAKKIAMILAIIVCITVLSIAFLHVKNTYVRTVIVTLGTIPQLTFIYYLINSNNYKFLFRIINIGYFLAFLSILIISYHLKYVI